MDDQARELAHPEQKRAPVRLVPDQVDVARERVQVHDHVERSRPDNLIREVDAVAVFV